jgi:ABC-type transporter Mla subunit MlaD
LYPPYTSGPTLADGAVIPLSRTAAPLELDAIYDNLDSLATSLGPSGANKNGSVQDVLHSLARLAAGNGTNLHDTLVAVANALPAFTSDPDRVAALVTSLDQLTRVLAQHDSSLDQLYGDLATATKSLADERDVLGSAIANLQDGLDQLTRFIRTNKDAIRADTSQLATTAKAIVADQQALIDTFDTAALGFQNFANAVNPNAPCEGGSGTCPALSVRITMTSNVASIVATYCGATSRNAVPILSRSLGVGSADTLNTLCVYEASTEQGMPPAPGAPTGPDLGLSRFLR